MRVDGCSAPLRKRAALTESVVWPVARASHGAGGGSHTRTAYVASLPPRGVPGHAECVGLNGMCYLRRLATRARTSHVTPRRGYKLYCSAVCRCWGVARLHWCWFCLAKSALLLRHPWSHPFRSWRACNTRRRRRPTRECCATRAPVTRDDHPPAQRQGCNHPPEMTPGGQADKGMSQTQSLVLSGEVWKEGSNRQYTCPTTLGHNSGPPGAFGGFWPPSTANSSPTKGPSTP